MSTEDKGASSRRRAWWAVFLWPLVITGAGVLWYLSFVDELPAQVATHWGRGGPDGFTAREDVPWFALFGVLMTWLTGAVVLAVAAADGRNRRAAVGLAGGLATFITGVFVLTAYDQRGLSDGALARDAEWPLVLSLVAALVVWIAAAYSVPGHAPADTRARDAVPASSPRAQLGAGETPTWSRLAMPGRWFWVATGGSLLAVGLTGLLTGMWLFTVIVLVLVGGLMLSLSAFRVRVDGSGLSVAGAVGFPRWHIPLEDVAEARALAEVHPMREFGGWGYRMGLGGRTGFVVCPGPALEVERGDGTSWVITVDDPEEGAALLNALADRARG